METIILFGATGSVGAYTALNLKERGYNVIAVAKRISDNGFFEEKGIKYYSVDISKKQEFSKLPQSGIHQVLHFAGAMPAKMENFDPSVYINSIINGTLNILEYTRAVGALKIVFTQSISDILYLFGSTQPISPESMMRYPLIGDHSVYCISKISAVNLIDHYFYQYGIKRFILRMPTIYVYHPNPYYYVDGNIKWMGYRYIINKAMKGEPIEIWGNPSNKKEMVYIKDFTQLIACCVESQLDGGVYNVGSKNISTFEDQIKIIINVFSPKEKQSKIVYRPDMPSSPQFILDTKKAREELGYIPTYDCYKLFQDFKLEMENEPFCKLWGRSKLL